MATLLIELGVAELPTAAVESLSYAFLDGMKRELATNNIVFKGGKRFATARRLAVLFDDIANRQDNVEIKRRGPALAIAKDNNDNWTKAAIGFATSCGVKPDELTINRSPKGEWLFYSGITMGCLTIELIPKLFRNVIDNLPIDKYMRWGNGDNCFVRPIISLVMLLDDRVIDTKLFGIKSGNTSIGHRFHGSKMIKIPTARDYEQILADSYVIADIDKRRDMIVAQALNLVDEIKTGDDKYTAIIDNKVLTEVNAVVEYPVAILGKFSSRYLQIPQEVLIKTMQDNQKYFAVTDKNNNILPYFIAVSNIKPVNVNFIRKGNQRVIEPRFADAEFFWKNDKKKTLESRRTGLKKVIYQQKLGTVYQRSERIAQIAKYIAKQAEFNTENVTRAAKLAKCDLISEMVFEFGELQGVMGRYYAKNDGENIEVATAIGEQYLPRFAGDSLPKTQTGIAISLADKLENIVGGFIVGERPTGTKDPYALRRASLGIIRLLNETQLNLSLKSLLDFSVSVFAKELLAEKQIKSIKTYIQERLKGYYHEQGIRHDVFEAVRLSKPSKIKDFTIRVREISKFIEQEDANNLFIANKRISNILKAVKDIGDVNTDIFIDQHEINVFTAGRTASNTITKALKTGDYKKALNALTILRQPLDNLFAHVVVMADDETIKNNRLALLASIRNLFLLLADFSVIDTSVNKDS